MRVKRITLEESLKYEKCKPDFKEGGFKNVKYYTIKTDDDGWDYVSYYTDKKDKK